MGFLLGSHRGQHPLLTSPMSVCKRKPRPLLKISRSINACETPSPLTHPSIIFFTLLQMLSQSKGPYPQVMKPSAGGYWVEGFVEKRQSDSDHMLRMAHLDTTSYELLKNDAVNYYKQHFSGKVRPPQRLHLSRVTGVSERCDVI